MNQRVRLLAVIAVTVGGLAWALWGISPGAVMGALGSMRLGYVPAAMAVITAVFFARVLRFQLLLGDARPSLARQVVVCAIAFLGINVVPLRLGELVRSFMLLEDDVSWGTSLGAVVIERMVDLFSLLTMLLLVSTAVDLPADIVVRGIDVLDAGQQAIGLALVVLLAGLVALGVGHRGIVGGLARVPVVGERLVEFSTAFRTAVAELVTHPGRAAGVLGLSAGVWLGTIASAWLLLAAFPGLPSTWEVALTVTAATVAGMVALPTPGFFGPFEVFCKAVLVLWAVEPSAAATFAIVWHLHQFGFHVVSGGGFLVKEGLSLGALVRESMSEGS